MSFHRDGYELCKSLIHPGTIRGIRAEMVDIMRPYCDRRVRGPDELDEAFAQITRLGGALRGNVLKLCSRLASLPLLLAEPGVQAKIREIGIRTPVIQAYSVLCMEPHVERFLFEPHQDLKQRMSFSTLAFWIPLSSGANVGGLGIAAGSHTKGPLRHGLSARGQLVLPPDTYEGVPQVELTDYAEGDCLIFSPYLIHWSIPNAGETLRWTVSLKIDDVSAPAHLAESIHPFVIEDYVDTRSNEERIAEAERTANRTHGA
jgi:hypothetical protein